MTSGAVWPRAPVKIVSSRQQPTAAAAAAAAATIAEAKTITFFRTNTIQ